MTELDPLDAAELRRERRVVGQGPEYDPGNKYSMAWQSGLTGIGYLTEKVSRPPTTMDDLMNPDIVGTSSVGMITGDMPDLVMIHLGIDPVTSGSAGGREPRTARCSRTLARCMKFYDQGYIDDFTAGNLAASMAWSGDVLYYKIWENKPYERIVPGQGAPVDRQHDDPGELGRSQGAYQLMDYVYQPEIAQLITEWVAYMSPVPAVQDLIAQHATEESGEYAADLADMAENLPRGLTTPPRADPVRSQPHDRRGTREWDNIFVPITET